MLDTTLLFDGTISSAGVPTGAAITATRDSTNVIDFGVDRDVGAGYKLEVVVDVTVAFATLTSLTVDLQIAPDNGGVAGTYYSILLSNVYPAADLIIGAPIFRYTIPPNQGLNWAVGVLQVPGRFMKLVYTVAGSNATVGKVFSFINMANDRNQYTSYPKNYTIRINAGQL